MRNLTIFTRKGFVSALFFMKFRLFGKLQHFGSLEDRNFLFLGYKKTAHLLGLIMPKPNLANRLISGLEVDYPSTLAGPFEKWMQLSELNIQILFDNVNFQKRNRCVECGFFTPLSLSNLKLLAYARIISTRLF